MRDVWVGLILLAAPQAAPAQEKKPVVPLYTNDDLERVAPFRNETGVASVPPAETKGAALPVPTPSRGRGEDYWRREAARVRQQVRRLGAQAASLQSRIEAEKARPWRSRVASRRSRVASREPELEARLAALQREARELEDELSDRARRDGALPGWLR